MCWLGTIWANFLTNLFILVVTHKLVGHFFFFLDTAMLSIRFGYGRPAAEARALAADFCESVSFVDFFFGFGVSHTFLAIFLMPIFSRFYALFNSFNASFFG